MTADPAGVPQQDGLPRKSLRCSLNSGPHPQPQDERRDRHRSPHTDHTCTHAHLHTTMCVVAPVSLDEARLRCGSVLCTPSLLAPPEPVHLEKQTFSFNFHYFDLKSHTLLVIILSSSVGLDGEPRALHTREHSPAQAHTHTQRSVQTLSPEPTSGSTLGLWAPGRGRDPARDRGLMPGSPVCTWQL